jgi:hypothetical protein
MGIKANVFSAISGLALVAAVLGWM